MVARGVCRPQFKHTLGGPEMQNIAPRSGFRIPEERSMKRLVLALALLTSPLAAQAPAALPRAFDAYVARTIRQFQVPGVAVAIVKDGKVVLTKGYGVRRLGDPTPVDERTLFGIASNTKAFTATALGILVEEGKLQWDAPVVNYLPWFEMYDSW